MHCKELDSIRCTFMHLQAHKVWYSFNGSVNVMEVRYSVDEGMYSILVMEVWYNSNGSTV